MREPKIKVFTGVVHPVTIAPIIPNAIQTLSRVDAYVYLGEENQNLIYSVSNSIPFEILQVLKRTLVVHHLFYLLFPFLHRCSEQKS